MTPRSFIFAGIVAGFVVVGWAQAAQALPAGFREGIFSRGLKAPTSMAFAPDGRLFVTEQGGSVRIIDRSGKLRSQPFMTLRVDSSGERGILGLGFDPNFIRNRHIYLYYTVPGSPPHNRVRRFTASATDPNRVIKGSGRTIMDLPGLNNGLYHNGGAIHFGPDGKLYVGVGDNHVGTNAQSLRTRFGKLLRVNADGSIPRDNPFLSRASGVNRAIWALGLRNPFTFAFDMTNGALRINDVGASTWEEVNRGRRGGNYGWPHCEGRCGRSGVINPIYQYANSGGSAITGGTFYRAAKFGSAYQGSYFFSDYLLGFIRRIDSRGAVTRFHTTAKSPVDLDVGPDGVLYYLSVMQGRVYRITK